MGANPLRIILHNQIVGFTVLESKKKSELTNKNNNIIANY